MNGQFITRSFMKINNTANNLISLPALYNSRASVHRRAENQCDGNVHHTSWPPSAVLGGKTWYAMQQHSLFERRRPHAIATARVSNSSTAASGVYYTKLWVKAQSPCVARCAWQMHLSVNYCIRGLEPYVQDFPRDRDWYKICCYYVSQLQPVLL